MGVSAWRELHLGKPDSSLFWFLKQYRFKYIGDVRCVAGRVFDIHLIL